MKIKIDEYLESLPKNEIIYYYPNPGNAGDALIACATFKLFRKLGIKYRIVDYREQCFRGKIFVYPGGGNLVRYYDTADRVLRKVVNDDPRKIIVLPHTIEAHKYLLKNMKSNVDIICRDPVSYQYVKDNAVSANVFLADDLFFSADVKEILQKNILLLMGGFLFKYKPRRELLKAIKEVFIGLARAYNVVHSKKRIQSGVLNAFRTDEERTDINIPDDNIDISLPPSVRLNHETIAEINSRLLLMTIDHFKEIRTNRLHIAIAGALLGKEVFLYPNNYFKNEAVYNSSLKHAFPNVCWVSNS